MLKVVLIAGGALLAAAAIVMIARIGPRNLVGMVLYDRRREGDLAVGSRAPDVELCALDGSSRVRLLPARGERPLVLVFGSFT